MGFNVLFTLKYLLWVPCKVKCFWNQTSHYTNLASSLKYDFTKAKSGQPEIQYFVAVKCTTRQLHHELEKLRFYPEIELIMLVLWQPVAPFGSSCVLNRMSCASSFPLKTQNKKNRSVRGGETTRAAKTLLWAFSSCKQQHGENSPLKSSPAWKLPLGYFSHYACPLMILKVSQVFLFSMFRTEK